MPEQISDFVTLRGRVVSGRGTASKIKAFSAEVVDFFGEPPVRGSINLALDKPVRFDPEQIEFTGGKRAFFWASEIGGMRCLITRAKGHPLHIIESFLQFHNGFVIERPRSYNSILILI